jgi:phage-related protein
MARSAELVIDIITDATKAVTGADDAARAVDKVGAAAAGAARDVDKAQNKMAALGDSADNLDSKAAQATGALGALSSGFELVGLQQYADGLNQAAMATDFLAGVGEGLNLVTNLSAVAWMKERAAKIASAAASKASAAAQWLLNAAMSANPIGLVVIAVIALIAVIVLLWKKSETFRSIVLGVWAAIKTAAAGVIEWLRTAWRSVFAALSAAVRVMGAVFRTIWAAIKTAAATVVSSVRAIWAGLFNYLRLGVAGARIAITAAFNAVRTVATTIANAVKSAWTTVFNALKSAVGSVGSALSGPFHTVERAIDAVISAVRSLIDWFSRIHVPKISIPSIPGFNSTAAAATSPTIGTRTTATTRAARPGVTIVVQGALDPDATARQIRRILTAHDRRMGTGGAGLRMGTV